MPSIVDATNDHRYRHVPGLNLLRGLAALMVCLFHCKKYIWQKNNPYEFVELFEYGYLGVYVFFIVSGFVIPYSMYINRFTITKFGRYLLKRTVRIEPPYILFILLLFIWNVFVHQLKGWGSSTLFGLEQFFLNITYLAPFFHVKWIVVIFWTLGVEFQFYVLSGLTHNIYLRNRWARYGSIVAFITIGKLIPADYYTVFNYYVFFAIGFQTFLHYTGRINRTEFGVTVVALLFFVYLKEIPAAVPFSLLSIAGILFIRNSTAAADFLGKISYSLYLTHGLAGGAIAVFMIGVLSPIARFATAVGVAIIFATVYYTLIERYFLQQSKRIRY